MSSTQHVEELIPFYLLGALDESERQLVDAHLPQCATCTAILNEMKDGAGALPFAVTPITPSSRVKQALMAQVQKTLPAETLKPAASARPRVTRAGWLPRLREWSPGIALAGILLLLISVGYALVLQGELNQLEARNASLMTQLNDTSAVLALLSNPAIETKNLQGSAGPSSAHGLVHFDPRGNRAWLVVSGLKPLSPGRAYEVWLIKGQNPVGVGTFTVDSTGAGQILINAPETIAAYQVTAVTDEPSGGSLLPTTPIVIAGQF
jgi:anti-sigma-K factor RskA